MLDTLIQKLAKEMEIEGSLATEVPGVYSISVDEKHVALLTSTPRGRRVNTRNFRNFYF